MLAACASTRESLPAATDQTAEWAANGWLAPGRDADPEIVGLYLSREECDAAVAGWIAGEAAGAHGECLPIDRR